MKKMLYLLLFVLFAVNSQAAIKVADTSASTAISLDVAAWEKELPAAASSKLSKKAGKQKMGFFKKMQLKLANKMLKKASTKKASDMPQAVYIILSIFWLGWLAMGVLDDWQGSNWWICLLLYFLFWLPGFIFALVKMGDYY